MTAASRPGSAPGPPPPRSAADPALSRPPRAARPSRPGDAWAAAPGQRRACAVGGAGSSAGSGGQRRHSHGVARTAVPGPSALTARHLLLTTQDVQRAKGSASCSLSYGDVLCTGLTQREHGSQTTHSPALGFRLKAHFRQLSVT